MQRLKDRSLYKCTRKLKSLRFVTLDDNIWAWSVFSSTGTDNIDTYLFRLPKIAKESNTSLYKRAINKITDEVFLNEQSI